MRTFPPYVIAQRKGLVMKEPLLEVLFLPTTAQYKRIIIEITFHFNKKYRWELALSGLVFVFYLLVFIFRNQLFSYSANILLARDIFGWGALIAATFFAKTLQSGGLLFWRVPADTIRSFAFPFQYLFFDDHLEFHKETDSWQVHANQQWCAVKSAVQIKGDFVLLTEAQGYYWLPHEQLSPEQTTALHGLLAEKCGDRYVRKGKNVHD
jgi:hypothetical protein